MFRKDVVKLTTEQPLQQSRNNITEKNVVLSVELMSLVRLEIRETPLTTLLSYFSIRRSKSMW
jgi:hypothetical protein